MIIYIFTLRFLMDFTWINNEMPRQWRPLRSLHNQTRVFLSCELRKMTWGSCAVFMCPPLATQDSVLGCRLLECRWVVSLFVCFSLSRLVQACSCSCSNSVHCSLNLASPSSTLSQHWDIISSIRSADWYRRCTVCACLWALTDHWEVARHGELPFPLLQRGTFCH